MTTWKKKRRKAGLRDTYAKIPDEVKTELRRVAGQRLTEEDEQKRAFDERHIQALRRVIEEDAQDRAKHFDLRVDEFILDAVEKWLKRGPSQSAKTIFDMISPPAEALPDLRPRPEKTEGTEEQCQ